MDSYQAIYDAVRSKIGGCNIGEAVAEQARQSFDISWQVSQIKNLFESVAYEHQRPFMLLRPKMFIDGDHWCALYGENLQDGVAAFGETPEKAATNFDIAWLNERAVKPKCSAGEQ